MIFSIRGGVSMGRTMRFFAWFFWATVGVGALAVSVSARPLVVCDDVSDPATLDPQRQFSEKNHTLLQQIYEGLVRFAPDGKIEPALATSWERVDPLRVRFKLRPGVRFHDGTPFSAESVRYSIQRYLDPSTGFPAIGFLISLDHVEIVNDLTVDIVTHFPDGLLLNRLAGFVLIVPSTTAVKGGGDLANAPNGTGPFKFGEWKKGNEISLLANRDYWMPKVPSFDSLIFRFVPSDHQMEALFKGEVDLLTELPGTMTTQVMSHSGTRILKGNTFWTVGATMNLAKKPLSDLEFRKALNLAIDRNEIVRYDSFGNGQPLATLSMPGQGGHNDGLAPYPYDPKRAKQILSNLGYENVTLKTLVRVHGLRTARIIKTQLAKVGISLDIKSVNTDADVIHALQSEPWDIAIAGLPDPMCHSFFAESILLFSGSPFSLTKDAEFDGRLQRVVTTVNESERETAAQQLDSYIYDQALSLFTYQRIKTYALRTDVNFIPSVSSMPHFFRTTFGN